MFILLAALLLFFVFVYCAYVVELIRFSIPSEKLQIWWLRNHVTYPERRRRCWCLSRWVQDVVFKLDKEAYQLNYASNPRERVLIKRAVACSVIDDDIALALQDSTVNAPLHITWSMPVRNLVNNAEEEDKWLSNRSVSALSQGLRSGQRWAQEVLEESMGDLLNVTDHMQAQWAAPRVDDFLRVPFAALGPTEKTVMVCIEYFAGSDIAAGTPSALFRTVYIGAATEAGGTLSFPPHHPDATILKGLDIPKLTFGSVDGLDLTDELKAVCGPKHNFYKDVNPLTYSSLWFALWSMEDVVYSLGSIVLEDSHLDTFEI